MFLWVFLDEYATRGVSPYVSKREGGVSADILALPTQCGTARQREILGMVLTTVNVLLTFALPPIPIFSKTDLPQIFSPI